MRVESTYNILTLSGGGVRGIFQATLLKYIEEDLYKGTPLYQMFDMVVGTSTGAIVASALALGISMKQVEQCYKDEGEKIFDKKKLKYIRSEWYSSRNLKEILKKQFEERKMSDAKCKLLITTTCLDNYKQALFTNNDSIQIVDAVMSSTAAPFYFPCYTFKNETGRSYMDGGLWANNPSLVAIMYAVNELNIPIERIRVLSIGTTYFSMGSYLETFNNARTFQAKKIRTVISAMFNSTESYSEHSSRKLLPKGCFLYINPTSKSYIDLSDAQLANEDLPKLAQEQYDLNKDKILQLIGSEGRKTCDYDRSDFISENSILNVGLADFVSSRIEHRDSDKHRDFQQFLQSAEHSIRIISVSLNDAIQNHGLVPLLEDILKRKKEIKVFISLLNYDKDSLLDVMYPILNLSSKEALATQIKESLERLKSLAKNKKIKSRVSIKLHNTVPFGTTIILDEDDESGKLIIETKPYKMEKDASFSFELLNKEKPDLFGNIVNGFKILDNENTKFNFGNL